MRPLNARQQHFVNEYLIDRNATQAAIRAGYSKKCAYSDGSKMLSYPNIQQALQVALKEQEERTQIKADIVLNRLWEEANDYDYEENRATATSRIKALETVGKHLGMFTEKIQIENTEPTIEEILLKIAEEDERETN